MMHAQISRKTGYATGVRFEHLDNGITEMVSTAIPQEPVLTKTLQIFFDLKYYLHFAHPNITLKKGKRRIYEYKMLFVYRSLQKQLQKANTCCCSNQPTYITVLYNKRKQIHLICSYIHSYVKHSLFLNLFNSVSTQKTKEN